MTITDDDGFEYDSDLLLEQMSDSDARREYGEWLQATGRFEQ